MLGYDYRIDGNFLVRVKCEDCGEMFDKHALSNACAPDAHKCDACIYVRDSMAEDEEAGK